METRRVKGKGWQTIDRCPSSAKLHSSHALQRQGFGAYIGLRGPSVGRMRYPCVWNGRSSGTNETSYSSLHSAEILLVQYAKESFRFWTNSSQYPCFFFVFSICLCRSTSTLVHEQSSPSTLLSILGLLPQSIPHRTVTVFIPLPFVTDGTNTQRSSTPHSAMQCNAYRLIDGMLFCFSASVRFSQSVPLGWKCKWYPQRGVQHSRQRRTLGTQECT